LTTTASQPRRRALTLGQKIRIARLEQRLTQEQLAGSDLTKSYISEVERGRRIPRLLTLKVLARRLNRPLSHFRDGVPEDEEAEAYLRLGLARVQAGAAESAIAPLEKALDLTVQQGEEVPQARIELALAMVDQTMGLLSRAQRRLDRCLRVLVRAGDAAALADAHCCLGLIKSRSGDPASALWAFRAGLRFAEGLPYDPALRSRLYFEIGSAHHTLGDMGGAREAFGAALEAAAPFQDHPSVATWHLEQAEAAAGNGRYEQACEHAGNALAIHEALAHTRRLAEIHACLGALDGEEGRWEDAMRHYRWSAVLNGAAANLPGSVQTLARLAEVLLDRVSPEAARVMCETALDLLGGDPAQGELAGVLRILGTIHRMAGRHAEAKAMLQESLALASVPNRKDDARLARQELALLALEAGDSEEARRHLETLRATP
jgi:tetratricopeptide (TPR) repeat protein